MIFKLESKNTDVEEVMRLEENHAFLDEKLDLSRMI
jgi:hypothetical protein